MPRTLISALALLALGACHKVPRAAPASDALPPAIDEAALDRTTSPCDDFFQFACGGWLARTEIPADLPLWHRGFSEIRERNLALLRRILETAAAGKADPADRFVGFAQSWCAKYREEALRLRAVTDPHSPARFRVNGPLSNLSEFAGAFRCAEGSPMVRRAERRCEVW